MADIEHQLADHDKRLAVVETQVKSMSGDLAEIKADQKDLVATVTQNTLATTSIQSSIKTISFVGAGLGVVLGAIELFSKLF